MTFVLFLLLQYLEGHTAHTLSKHNWVTIWLFLLLPSPSVLFYTFLYVVLGCWFCSQIDVVLGLLGSFFPKIPLLKAVWHNTITLINPTVSRACAACFQISFITNFPPSKNSDFSPLLQTAGLAVLLYACIRIFDVTGWQGVWVKQRTSNKTECMEHETGEMKSEAKQVLNLNVKLEEMNTRLPSAYAHTASLGHAAARH